MRGVLEINPKDPIPIWRQIENGMRRLAVSGALEPGAAVPSVRELARELQVNPATVAKAYQRLSDQGVLTVRRGEGTFIAEREAHEVSTDRAGILTDGAHRYAEVARSVGATRSEAVSAVEKALEELPVDTEGGDS
jgi:GntR family transcriptional regulator